MSNKTGRNTPSDVGVVSFSPVRNHKEDIGSDTKKIFYISLLHQHQLVMKWPAALVDAHKVRQLYQDSLPIHS